MWARGVPQVEARPPLTRHRAADSSSFTLPTVSPLGGFFQTPQKRMMAFVKVGSL